MGKCQLRADLLHIARGSPNPQVAPHGYHSPFLNPRAPYNTVALLPSSQPSFPINALAMPSSPSPAADMKDGKTFLFLGGA